MNRDFAGEAIYSNEDLNSIADLIGGMGKIIKNHGITNFSGKIYRQKKGMIYW